MFSPVFLLEPLELMIAYHGVDHIGVRLVVTQGVFQADRVVTGERRAAPFKLPWFERFRALVFALVVCGELGLGIIGRADEATVHAVLENINEVGSVRHERKPLGGSLSLEFSLKRGICPALRF